LTSRREQLRPAGFELPSVDFQPKEIMSNYQRSRQGRRLLTVSLTRQQADVSCLRASVRCIAFVAIMTIYRMPRHNLACTCSGDRSITIRPCWPHAAIIQSELSIVDRIIRSSTLDNGVSASYGVACSLRCCESRPHLF